MGQYWLRSMPDVLRNAGLVVDTYDGWETRARSTGGYDDVRAVQVHHTASSSSPAGDMSYMWNGSPDRPVGAIYLARDGRLTVGAAGATNTSGKGGPLATSRGTIPLDSANKYVISIEAANNGVGEQWPAAQIDAYIRAVAALNATYGLQTSDTHSHWEWTTRKIDPAGNSPYASGGDKWNMNAFRNDVQAISAPVPPLPGPDPDPEDEEMKIFACEESNHRVWVGDGIRRRAVHSWETWSLMVLQSNLGSGPPIHSSYDVGQRITDPNQINGITYDGELLNCLGQES